MGSSPCSAAVSTCLRDMILRSAARCASSVPIASILSSPDVAGFPWPRSRIALADSSCDALVFRGQALLQCRDRFVAEVTDSGLQSLRHFRPAEWVAGCAFGKGAVARSGDYRKCSTGRLVTPSISFGCVSILVSFGLRIAARRVVRSFGCPA